MTWLGVLLTAILAATGDQRVAILRILPRVSVKPGADVRIVVRVPQDAANRSLIFNFIGDRFERNSVVQLDGDLAPITHEFLTKGVPEGCYTVRAWIATAEGKAGKAYMAREEKVAILGPNTAAADCL